MAKKKNSGPKKYRSAEPFKGYKKDWQQDSRTMTNAEYKGYMNTNPYQERPAQSLVQGNLIDYLMQKRKQREASEQNTKTWRDRTVSGQNSGNPYQSYQEKMKIDSHGGVSGGGLNALYEDAVKNFIKNRSNDYDPGKTFQTQQQTAHALNSDDKWEQYAKAYANKAQGLSGYIYNELTGRPNPLSVEKGKTQNDIERSAKLAQGGLQTNKGGLWSEPTEEYKQAVKAGNAQKQRDYVQKLIENGGFDDQDDVALWSDAKKKEQYEKNNEQIANWQGWVDKLSGRMDEMDRELLTDDERVNRLLNAYVTPEIQNELAIINGAGYTEEQKKTAESRLAQLRGKAAAGVMEFVQSGGLMNSAGSTEKQEAKREELYDAMYGSGQYNRQLIGMSDEEKAALDKRLDDAMVDASYMYGKTEKDLKTAQGMLEYVNDQNKKIEQDNEFDRKYAEMMAGNVTGDTAYHAENDIAGDINTPTYSQKWKPVDEIYSIIGGNYDKDKNITNSRYHNAMLMLPEEIAQFNAYYNAGQKDEAWAFYQALEPYLNQAYSYTEKAYMQELAKQYPITSWSAARLANNVAVPLEFIANAPGRIHALITGQDNAQTDPYSDAYRATRFVKEVDNAISPEFGDLDWIYRGLTSGVDSALNIALAKGLGVPNMMNIHGKMINSAQAATLMLFSTQAFEKSLQNKMTQGHDPFGYDVMEAWIDAAIETATEIWSVENWLADPTNILTYVGKIAISEPSEEVVGAVVEPYIKEMLGHKNEWKERAKDILAHGTYTNEDGTQVEVRDMDTANRLAMREWNHQIRMAAQEALISVGPSIGMGSARIYYNNNVLGNAIQNGNINGTQAATQRLVEAGTQMGTDTESYKLARGMEMDLKKGKKISNYTAGKLAGNLMSETGEQINKGRRSALVDHISEQLKNENLYGQDQQEMAELITRALENKNGIDGLTKKERELFRSIPSLHDTYLNNRFNRETQAEALGKMAEATEKESSLRSTAETLVWTGQAMKMAGESRHMATVEDMKSAQGEKVEGSRGIILQTNDGNLHGKLGNLVTVTETDKNGNEQQVLKYRVEVNGKEMLADPNQILSTNLGTAWVITKQENNPNFYSTDYTNRLLKEMELGKVENPALFMRDADLIRYAAFENFDMPKTEIRQDTAQRLYDLARAEYVAQRAKDTSERTALKPGQGTAEYNGVQFDSKGWSKALEGLDDGTKEWMNTWGAVAKAAGVRLTFTDGAGMLDSNPGFKGDTRMLYGAESRNGIRINIEGRNFTTDQETGKHVAGEKHDIGVTFSHEFIHFLQRNTRNGYDNLAKYVLEMQRDALGQRGLNDRIEEIMRKKNLDLAGAISELVADSCDQIFSNEKIINHIAETNQSLYKNLKSFVKNLLEKVKNALGSMRNSISRDAFRIMNRNMSRLADLFNLAWDEAMSGEMDYSEEEYRKAQELLQEAMENPVERFSFAEPVEMREDGLIAVHNLSEQGLRGNIRFGGIPMASIAVMSAEKVWTGYGPISFYFGRDVVDPMLGNRMYNGDAMTPTLGNTSFQTAEEALEYMENLPERDWENAFSLTSIFRNFKKITNLEEARKKAYAYKADAAERNKAYRETTNLERSIRDGVANAVYQAYNGSNKNIDYFTYEKATSIGILLAAEEMEQRGDLTTAEQYEILMKNIDRAMQELNVKNPINAVEGNEQLADIMLDFIDKASQLETLGEFMEAKTPSVINFDSVFAVQMPESLRNTDLEDLLSEMGVDRTNIFYYDDSKNAFDNRVAVGKEIPQYVPGVRFSQAETENGYKNTEGVNGVPNALRTGKMGNNNPSVINSVADAVTVVNNDEAYRAAVERGDLAAAISMVMEKLKSVDGVIPFMAPNWHSGEDQKIAENLKKNDPEAIRKAADAMAKLVPDNAVLIPMPGSNGRVEKGSWTMNLTNRISEITGRPAVVALEGNEHESRQKAKQKGETGPLQEELGFRKIAEIPEGTIPIFIDNTVGSGVTADAARVAMGGGMTLAYTKTLLSKGIPGLKNAVVTYASKKDGGALIPLSQRFNVSRRDVRYSSAEVDEQYMQAVESGNVELQQRMVDQAAQQAGYTIKAYHGSNNAFTVFNGGNRNEMWFASTAETAYNRNFMYNTYLKMKNPVEFTYYIGAESKFDPTYVTEQGRLNGHDGAIVHFMLNPDYVKDSLRFLSKYAETLPATDSFGDNFTYMPHGQDRANLAKPGELMVDFMKRGASEALYNWYCVYNPEQIKNADPVTYDDQGNVIPPSERFNSKKTDIRWSKAEDLSREEQAEVDAAEENGIDLDIRNHTASRFSRASFERSEYYNNPEEMARMLARNVLGKESKANIAKAAKWIRDVTSISAMIGERSDVLDYIASPGRSSFKSNPEYGGSIDSSTICAKRRMQTGTIDAIQRAMPDYVMTAEDFLQIRRMMKERGYEVSCGLCFVESSRKNIAKYASQFMREWNSQHPDNQVNMVQINTVLGLEDTRINNKEVYEAYEKFMNKLAQRKPKLFEMRSEYDNDIIKHFRNDDSVAEKNKRGGMRINSFSDFEIVHLIDMMQVIMDMSNVGLAGQAYTKVREFAEALGPTGLKINMSMIAAGVDENGRIIFDEVEGMKWSDVEELRNKYADNVGTVCVVFTEDQLLAAMADDRIDFIIPFHRSQWNKSNYKDIGLPDNVKDFTYWQNERYRNPVYGTKKDGTQKKLRATNYMPNEYWNPELSGKENAEAYLQMCFENNKIPKFWKWLQANGNGSYSLKADGSTDGYWKLLGDFKMYNHITGEYAAQLPVRPEFDMDASERMLREYKGGHEVFPEASDVVRDFVAEKTKGKKGISRGQNGKIALAGNEITRASQWSEEGMDVNQWMMSQTPGSLQTEDEAALVQAYKDLRIKLALSTHRIEQYEQRIKRLEAKADLTAEERDELMANRNRLEIQRKKLADLEDELYRVTSTDGYAGMMYRQNMVLKDYIQGKTQDQVRQTVEEMQKQVQKAQEQIRKDIEDLKQLGNTQAVKTMKSFMGKTSLSRMASLLRKNYNSSLSKAEIEDRLAEMALKQQSGQDITTETEALAQDLLDRMRGVRSDALEYLRGATLRIGDDMLTEYVKERKIDQQVKKGKAATDESVMRRAKQIALREMKEQIKGSGVKLIAEEGSSSFIKQWNELREKNGGLKDLSDVLNEMHGLHEVLDYIQEEVENSRGINQNDINFDEVALVVRAAVGNVTTFLSGDPEARKQINNLMGQIAELSGRTEEIADRMEDLNRQMDEVVLAGQKAKGWTTVLQRDVKEAIKYYNKTAKVAAENERTKVRKQLIEQLRSENTRKLIEQEEKFKERMKNDKTARELANDNLMLRRKITTVTKRLATLLTKETDLKNIPEKAKPLARQMIRMIVNHDLSYRMITFGGREGLSSVIKTLDILDAREGKFRDEDLDWLIRGEGETADYDVRDAVILALIDIESGLMEYRNAEGRGNTSLLDRKNALAKVQKATATIYNVIHASQVAEINGRQMMVMDLALDTLSDMGSSRFKGEHTGWFGRKIGAVRSGIGYKNMTPEYFIKNLKNKTLSRMYDEYHQAENKAGLMYGQAQKILQQIAKDAGYDTWDQKKKYTIKLEKGGKVELNLEQLMQIYATWKREATLQAEIGVPEKTYHLTTGGFYVEQEAKHKINGREFFNNRAQKITEEDFYQIQNLLTEEQKRYVDNIVQYMSDDMSRLGNEASMRMYGIKKYNEKYYFPFEIWNGVKSVKSDAGAGGNTESHRGAHPSFSNRLRNNASNALMIRGFTKMAAKHIVQMINYNTFAPAIENLQRVMNSQVTTGEEDNLTARNLWAAFGERYGKDALNYLQDFQKAINGGVNQYENTIYDKLLSIFKKNAVAGSLSVAAQQPLSYIRAAMMISPKYLTLAMNPATYKGSMDEMMKYSGVAVIKNMGKFDMNFGQSAQDYITPEAQKSKGRAAYDWISDKTTILPQMMDAVTWTRMWTAAKLEQQALNPEMDHKSDEFMNKVAERFNEIMRMTQVYDSVMVKSPNLRSQNPWVKTFTSFMAEPTLSANVLVDAAVNFKEKGGKKHLVKALATFMASAAAQAAAKGFFGAGRSPDDRKNREENFLYKFWYNLLSEINPLGLIPGYNDVIEALTKGELKDDAMGIIGKVPQIVGNMLNLFKESGGTYRDIEESLGQIIQLTTNVPAKNLMRDFRAMVTFFGGGQLLGAKTYADRPTSDDVLKYQMQDMFMTNDLVGMINTWLGDKGYDSSNSAYYNRIYEAEKAGDTQAAEEMKEYLRKSRNTKEDTIKEGIQKAVKADDSMSAAEQTEWMIKEGLTDNTGTVTQQYRDGKISRKEATQLLKQMNPELSDDDIWWKLDLIDYKNETGKKDVSGKYYRLTDAINANKADQITSAVNDLLKHGYTKEQIKDKLSGWKKEYLAADSKERVRIRDAITKAYKAAGYTVDDANKTIEKWTKEKKKK